MGVMMNSFITGSHAHGTPHEKSDIDLAILVSEVDAEKLWRERDRGPSVRYGILNLIVFASPTLFEIWKEVNDGLVKIGPVHRDVAVKAFSNAGFNKGTYGVPDGLDRIRDTAKQSITKEN